MAETETAVVEGNRESKGLGHLNKRKENISCVDIDEVEGNEDDEVGGFSCLELQYATDKIKKAIDDGSSSSLSVKAGVSMEEIAEAMRYGSGRRGRKRRKIRGGGFKNTRVDPMVTRSLGEATLLYTKGCLKDAVLILKEVVVAAPNAPAPYHMLGLVYASMGENAKALNCYMLAAHLRPRDSSLWKLLVTLSAQQGKTGQAKYCLRKAITADPEDTSLISLQASLYVELKDYLKAVELYEKLLAKCPDSVQIMTSMCDLYVKCGEKEKAVTILEDFLTPIPYTNNLLPLLHLLTSICFDCCEFEKALHHISRALSELHEPPLDLRIKEGICYTYLGESVKAEQVLAPLLILEDATEYADLVLKIGDSNSASGRHELALKYYLMLPDMGDEVAPSLYAKIAECYRCLNEIGKAILYMYKVLHVSEGDIVCRLNLASLLVDQGKDDEAISLLSQPENSQCHNSCGKPWWLDGRIRLVLARIYRGRGDDVSFVGVIFSAVRDSLVMERCRWRRRGREKSRPRISKSVLRERAKLLDGEGDNIFRGFKPVACSSDLSKALRARVILRRKEEEEGMSESSEEEEEVGERMREASIHNIVLKKEERGDVVVELCEALESMGKNDEAMEIISLALRVCLDERLVSMGARMVSHTRPDVGFDFSKCVVEKEPHNIAAWNSYYRLVSKIDFRFHRHCKFVHRMRVRHKDCVPPIIISGHQLTMISQHQAAAREYLQAYRLVPNNPLVNLCVGVYALLSVFRP